MLLVLFMIPFFSNALIVSCGCAQVSIVQGLIMLGFLIKISYRCLRVSPMFPYYGCLIRLCITYFISVVSISICFHLYRPCLNGKRKWVQEIQSQGIYLFLFLLLYDYYLYTINKTLTLNSEFFPSFHHFHLFSHA